MGELTTLLLFALSPGILIALWGIAVLRRLGHIKRSAARLVELHERECEYLSQLPVVKTYQQAKAARLRQSA